MAQSNAARVVLRRGAELLECASDAVPGLPAYTFPWPAGLNCEQGALLRRQAADQPRLASRGGTPRECLVAAASAYALSCASSSFAFGAQIPLKMTSIS